MKPLKILIIGAGTVGHTLGSLITAAGHEVTYQDEGPLVEDIGFDVIHYTVPMVDINHWCEVCNGYRIGFKPKYFIIEASIIPQALEMIIERTYPTLYSPIRATEAIMLHQLKTMRKFWASEEGLERDEWLELKAYFTSIYPQGHQEFECAQSLAFGKLLEVVDFGLQIMFTQQVKLACDEHGWDFDEAYTKYRQESLYGANYNDLGPEGAPTHWIPRVICKPGVIGGKCVIQDAKLLEDADVLYDLMHLMAFTNYQFRGKMGGKIL